MSFLISLSIFLLGKIPTRHFDFPTHPMIYNTNVGESQHTKGDKEHKDLPGLAPLVYIIEHPSKNIHSLKIKS